MEVGMGAQRGAAARCAMARPGALKHSAQDAEAGRVVTFDSRVRGGSVEEKANVNADWEEKQGDLMNEFLRADDSAALATQQPPWDEYDRRSSLLNAQPAVDEAEAARAKELEEQRTRMERAVEAERVKAKELERQKAELEARVREFADEKTRLAEALKQASEAKQQAEEQRTQLELQKNLTAQELEDARRARDDEAKAKADAMQKLRDEEEELETRIREVEAARRENAIALAAQKELFEVEKQRLLAEMAALQTGLKREIEEERAKLYAEVNKPMPRQVCTVDKNGDRQCNMSMCTLM